MISCLLTVSIFSDSTAFAEEQVSSRLSLAWSGSRHEKKSIQKLLDIYQNEHPNISVKLLSIKQNEFMPHNLLSSSNAPDLILLKGTAIIEMSNYLLPLQSLPSIKAALKGFAFRPKALKRCMLDGKIFILPWFCLSNAILYNPAAFKEAGLSNPQSSWTWQEFIKCAQTLTLKTSLGNIRWGYMCLYDQYSEDADWIVLAGGTWGPNMYYYPETLEESIASFRSRPWLLRRQPWSKDIEKKYRQTIMTAKQKPTKGNEE